MNVFRRRIYFIEKKLQAKYIMLTVVSLVLYTGIFVILVFSPYMITLHFDYPLAEKTEAARALLLLHGTVWPGLVAAIFFFSLLSVFITHKVAGPLFRMKKDISQVVEGDLNVVVRLRKGDDMKDLAEKINLLIEELRTFVTASKNAHDLLDGYIRELEQEMARKSLTEESGKEIIGKIQASRKNIEAALQKFHLE
jgi:methyl-accepting chemotaxis protein